MNLNLYAKIFLLNIVIGATAQAATQSIELFPIQLQYRYEDQSDQTIASRQYSSFGMGYQYDRFRVTLEFNNLTTDTGNASSSVTEKIQDKILGLGYEVIRWNPAAVTTLTLNGFVSYGQTESEVATQLLGVTTKQSSDPQSLYGAGISGQLRISYFVAEAEGKILTSQNFSPQEVPTWALKLGLIFQF